jgi:hypothetical protein
MQRQAQKEGANPNWQIIATQIAIDLFKQARMRRANSYT